MVRYTVCNLYMTICFKSQKTKRNCPLKTWEVQARRACLQASPDSFHQLPNLQCCALPVTPVTCIYLLLLDLKSYWSFLVIVKRCPAPKCWVQHAAKLGHTQWQNLLWKQSKGVFSHSWTRHSITLLAF